MTSLMGIFDTYSDPDGWSNEKLNNWFEKGDWLNGWDVKPDNSINRKTFAASYFKNRKRWDKTFSFLKNNDLSKLEIKKYDIDGENAYAPVSEYISKNEEDARFEVHRKYIDIQYVIKGIEQISVAPLSARNQITSAYDEAKDIEFMTVKESSAYKATPGNFFIFFPSEIHRPCVRLNENTQVKKIVVKVRVD